MEHPLNVFFDVDYTLVMGDGSLRPRSRETFEQIIGMGHSIYVWSGWGFGAGTCAGTGCMTS
jgi:hydroxymethylpyrimidine pyrophosphatase-like HAD family hydrolase